MISIDVYQGNKGWIGVDLDGTLAYYDKWRGMGHIGAPIAPMADKVREWLKSGVNIKVFTARVCSGQRKEDVNLFMCIYTNWCYQHFGQQIPVTSEKDFNMIMLYDDRCVQVECNTGRVIGET
jgi:hypothetical protein